MSAALVTGANGFLGSNLVRELLACGYEVVAIGRDGRFNNLPDDGRVTKLSCSLDEIGSLPRLVRRDDIEFFFHFAWDGSAGARRCDYGLQLWNAARCCEAVEAAAHLGARRFIGAGSIMEDEVLAACTGGGNRPGAAYIYGSGKFAAHVMSSSVAAREDIDFLWGKMTNAYGVGELSPRLVNTTLRKCINGESPQFTSGTQNYDFVYVEDAVRAFRCIAEKGLSFNEYLIGSSMARPLREFLLEMKASIAPELEFKFGDVPFTGINLPLNMFDCSDLERDTGFKAEITFGEGCRRTYEWLKGMETDYEAV